MLKGRTLLLFFALIALSSCFKNEEAIELPLGNSEISTLFLGKDYEYDMYFEIGRAHV